MIWLGHVVSFTAMLIIGILLAMLDILLLKMVGDVLSFRLTLLLFWVSVAAYDIWDWLRLRGLITQ